MSIVELIIQLAVIANFFASIWLLIGQYNYYEKDSGWIKYNHEVLKIQNIDFWEMYISSIYFIITTFAGVGYGDIVGRD